MGQKMKIDSIRLRMLSDLCDKYCSSPDFIQGGRCHHTFRGWPLRRPFQCPSFPLLLSISLQSPYNLYTFFHTFKPIFFHYIQSTQLRCRPDCVIAKSRCSRYRQSSRDLTYTTLFESLRSAIPSFTLLPLLLALLMPVRLRIPAATHIAGPRPRSSVP